MKFLAVHPGPLMYTKIYLRLEPLGRELPVADGQSLLTYSTVMSRL